jgi:LysM repeat protein
LIDYSKDFLGKPYRPAGKGPNAFDCSGFTSFVFRKFGYKLSASSEDQDKQVPAIRRKEDLQIGDLVFFEGRRKNGKVGHVGIVIEKKSNGEFNFIHASTSDGVIITASTEPYYASRYLRGGRVLKEADRLTSQQTKKAQQKVVEDKNSINTLKNISENEANRVDLSRLKSSGKISKAQADDNYIVYSREASRKTVSQLASTTSHKNTTDNSPTNSGINQEKQTMRRPEYTTVPDPEEMEANPDSLSKDTVNNADVSIQHTVKMGETLYSISRKYNCTIEQIKSWNPSIGKVLKTGEILSIRNN